MSEAVASNASTNRKTVIEIANLPKGKKQLIQNINYGKCDFSKFIKILKITLKQSPDDPDYSIDRILTQSADGPPDVWTEETFPGEQLLALDKVSIKVIE